MPVIFALLLAGMLGMGAGVAAQHYNDTHPDQGSSGVPQQVTQHQN
jgi:hypothetical protein